MSTRTLEGSYSSMAKVGGSSKKGETVLNNNTCLSPPPAPSSHSPTQSDHHHHSTAVSPEGSPSSPSPAKGAANSDHDNSITPTRRNKRKMTEPKKRTDFSIKRICSDSGESFSDDERSAEVPAKRLRPSIRPQPSSSSHDEVRSNVSSSSTPPIPSPQPSPSSSSAARLAAAAAAMQVPGAAALMQGGLGQMFPGMLPVPNFYPGATPLISVLRPDTLEVLQQQHHHHLHQQQQRQRESASVSARRGSQGDGAGPSPSSESASSSSPPTPHHPSLPHPPAHLHHPVASTSRTPVPPPPKPTPHTYQDRDLASAASAELDTHSGPSTSSGGRRARKNYKNMTRERRVEANARERSRVHTISAAFESLRRAVPSYSYNQRLSKLAILRIACSYIMALSRLADLDYSPDQSKPSFAQCVDLCTRTIQAEGRAKRRH